MQKSSGCAVRYNNSVTETLLQTKLHIPLPRANFVPRPRLIAQLDQGLQQGSRLTLVCAPAGFGKTTLVCEWAAQQKPPIAYLSLDEADNDLQHFLAYFVAALQSVRPDLGEMANTMLRSPEVMAPK